MARKLKGQGQMLSGSPQPGFTNFSPKAIQANRAPTTADTGYELGQLWADTNGTTMYGLSAVSAGSATWNLLGPGASDVDTLTGDSGGAISPAGGNITLAGGTNITSVGAGSTITLNLDSTITVATSISSPIYTSTAADTNINAAAGQDIIIKMGDAAGANKVSFVDSASSEVFSIDSTGAIPTLTGLTNTGTFTTSGGTASVNASSNFNTVINSGTSTGSVTIGNAAAGAVSVETSAGISLDAATASNLTVTGSADLAVASTAGAVNITAGEAATSDGVNIVASAADGGVSLDAGSGGITIGVSADCTPIDIGNIAPSGARVITMNGGDSAQNDTLNIMSGNPSANTQTVTVLGGVPTGGTQVLNLLTQTGQAGTANIGTGAAMANAINIGGTGANTIAIGDTQTAGSVSIGAAMTGGTINIGGTGLQTGDIDIGAGTGAQTINLGTGATGIKTINLGTGAIDNVVTIGTATGAASLDLIAGTGNFTLEGATTTTYGISATGANTGTITISGGTGAQTTNIATGGTGIKTVNIGTGAIDNVVTVGTTTGAASLTLQAGTGDITVSGTVKELTSEFHTASGDYISSFSQSPILTTAADTAGVATGANGDVNLMYCQEGVLMEQFIIGTQTIIGPRMDSNGLLVSLDLTNAEGAEYNFGARSNARHAFTIGTDAAFFFEVGLYINDMDGAAPYLIGFRKVEANNATYTSYTDYATIGMIAASSTTNVVTATELNSGGTTVTDTTDAWGGDGSTNTLKVLVSAAGVVTYTINGSAPSASAAFTFDNGDVVMPYIHLVHSASATAVDLTSLKVGYQA